MICSSGQSLNISNRYCYSTLILLNVKKGMSLENIIIRFLDLKNVGLLTKIVMLLVLVAEIRDVKSSAAVLENTPKDQFTVISSNVSISF